MAPVLHGIQQRAMTGIAESATGRHLCLHQSEGDWDLALPFCSNLEWQQLNFLSVSLTGNGKAKLPKGDEDN